jgi:hypothetical protein
MNGSPQRRKVRKENYYFLMYVNRFISCVLLTLLVNDKPVISFASFAPLRLEINV